MHCVATVRVALVFIINPLLDDWNSESTDIMRNRAGVGKRSKGAYIYADK